MNNKANRMTINQIKGIGLPIISVPYCRAQHLLRGLDRIGYAAGVYGWNYDVYQATTGDQTYIICTGYRAKPGVPAKDTENYNRLAMQAMQAMHTPDATTALASMEIIRCQWLQAQQA